MRGKTDGLGCSIDCGETCSKTLVVSKFLRSSQPNFADIKILRKEVADYCFLDDYNFPKEKMVFLMNESYLTREDIMSMLPDRHMYGNIVECWSILLNKLEFEQKSTPSMAFMGIRNADIILSMYEAGDSGTPLTTQTDRLFVCWDTFIGNNIHNVSLDVDLLFIPLCIEVHYFCVCINFVTKRVEVLDYNFRKNWEESDVTNVAKLVASQMSDYYETLNLSAKVEEIAMFEVVNVPFKWQTPSLIDNESGCFLMMHMACYEGKPYESNLGLKKNRNIFVVEIAAALLLSDSNEKRTSLLGSIDSFRNDKEAIWDEVKRKRATRVSSKSGRGRGGGRGKNIKIVIKKS